jgi:hypothetical protein
MTSRATIPRCFLRRFVRRLLVCARWQLRWKVAINAAKEWAGGMATGAAWLSKGAFVLTFGIVVSPFLQLWHFSLGIVWHAATLSDSDVDKLERNISPNVQDQTAASNQQPKA